MEYNILIKVIKMKEKLITLFSSVKDYFNCLCYDIKSIKRSTIIDFFKNRIKFILILILFLLMIFGYKIGRFNNSKNIVLSKVEVALKAGDGNELRKFITVDGKKVGEDVLEPLVNYYVSDSNIVDYTMKKLKEGLETPIFTLYEEKGIFSSRYFLDVNTYTVKVKSNFKQGTFSLDGKEFIDLNESFNGVIPGVYTVTGKLESDYGEFEELKNIVVMNDEEVEIDFNAIYVSVKSKFDDANIFINNENTGIKVGDEKEIGPLPVDGTIKIHIEKEFPWGNIKGDEVEVKDISDINLDIPIENEKLKKEIFDDVNRFYQSVFESLNNENENSIVGATDFAKDKISEILKKNYFILKNRYTIKEINIVEDKSQYYYENNYYRATIVVELNYDVSKKFMGVNKKSDSKKFFTKLVYKNGKWIIEDVENFNLKK